MTRSVPIAMKSGRVSAKRQRAQCMCEDVVRIQAVQIQPQVPDDQTPSPFSMIDVAEMRPSWWHPTAPAGLLANQILQVITMETLLQAAYLFTVNIQLEMKA